MQTIKIKYRIDNQNDQLLLGRYIKQYNHVYRVAFNKLQNGIKNKVTDLCLLNNIELLDSWFIQSASYEAKFLHSLVGNEQKVIFGGKKNFFNRLKGLISKAKFNEQSSNKFSSLETKSPKHKSSSPIEASNDEVE